MIAEDFSRVWPLFRKRHDAPRVALDEAGEGSSATVAAQAELNPKVDQAAAHSHRHNGEAPAPFIGHDSAAARVPDYRKEPLRRPRQPLPFARGWFLGFCCVFSLSSCSEALDCQREMSLDGYAGVDSPYGRTPRMRLGAVLQVLHPHEL